MCVCVYGGVCGYVCGEGGGASMSVKDLSMGLLADGSKSLDC